MKKIPKDLLPSKKFKLKCPACSYKNKLSKNLLISVYKDSSFPNYIYNKCKNCNSLYLCNFSKKKSLDFIHDKYYGKYENSKFQYRKTLNRNDKELVNEWVSYYKNKVSKKNKSFFLDIGGGNGECAQAFYKMKFSSYIYEPDKKCIKYIKKKFKNLKIIDSFERLILYKKKFDVITLNYSLEHLENPNQVISILKKIIKKNGKLFIHIPSSESLQIRYLKAFSWEITPPFHMTLFSLKGIEKFLNRHNFKIIKKFDDTNTWGWTRGIALRNKVGKEYELLRKNKAFRLIDLEVDKLFEKISIEFKKPSIISVCSTIKK